MHFVRGNVQRRPLVVVRVRLEGAKQAIGHNGSGKRQARISENTERRREERKEGQLV